MTLSSFFSFVPAFGLSHFDAEEQRPRQPIFSRDYFSFFFSGGAFSSSGHAERKHVERRSPSERLKKCVPFFSPSPPDVPRTQEDNSPIFLDEETSGLLFSPPSRI